ncbi:Auxin response factor 18 [Zostera marina]|uniref:Auxin response factor n=1 Tax=Zostera marina TaxID=29655 RepID=A0A0K9PLV8_ZOSMR|nr:Auxin response factor 18 [Zostera marina]
MKHQQQQPEKQVLDARLWHACAGGLVQIPPVNSRVCYFPQGHAEHALGNVDFGMGTRIPALVLCKVTNINYMADPNTDEVFVKIRLLPVKSNGLDFDDNNNEEEGEENNGGVEDLLPEKLSSFAKTLTQSDANNGGGFSVPRYCAETIFPRLDYSVDPPVQTVLARDVHGEQWKFRHIYRGTPRRHLLTTGWSTFVNQKKLMAGDSIVFLRAENDELRVGIRRAKREIGEESSDAALSRWNIPTTGNTTYIPFHQYGRFSVFTREEESSLTRKNSVEDVNHVRGRVRVRIRAESVVEVANLAATGQPFDIVYYPRTSTPEFCVKVSAVKAANRIQWTPGMRFKMAFETEDSSRISWFMGTISGVQFADPIRWPHSPWRILVVAWDEPDILQNVKRVNPWLVELISNLPPIPLSPFSPPRKKLRVPQPFPDLSFARQQQQFPPPVFAGNYNNPLGSCSNPPAGIQGARHTRFGISLSDLHSSSIFTRQFVNSTPRISTGGLVIGNHNFRHRRSGPDNVSCLLTMGNSNWSPEKNGKSSPSPPSSSSSFLLFGKTIQTEKQISSGNYGEFSPVGNRNSWSDCTCPPASLLKDHHEFSELSLGNSGMCKVFMESENMGRSLDVSVLDSYDELRAKLAEMFGSDTKAQLLYRDSTGAVRVAGEEPLIEFKKSARRVTILMDSGTGV